MIAPRDSAHEAASLVIPARYARDFEESTRMVVATAAEEIHHAADGDRDIGAIESMVERLAQAANVAASASNSGRASVEVTGDRSTILAALSLSRDYASDNAINAARRDDGAAALAHLAAAQFFEGAIHGLDRTNDAHDDDGRSPMALALATPHDPDAIDKVA